MRLIRSVAAKILPFRGLTTANKPASAHDIERLVPFLQRFVVWADKTARARLQEHGINIVPSNFYSNTPSIAEIEASYEYSEHAPYLNKALFENDRMCQLLSALAAYSAELDPPRDGDEKNCNRYFWRNSQFSYSDAMSYYAFIRRLRPNKVLEIGGGFSTLIAAEALGRNGFGSLSCVEPFPRPFLTDGSISNLTLHQKRAQDISAELLNAMLGDGDILFIDSTHTVKTGSDCLHIYLRLLPFLRRNIFIHVHDVFLPFGMPKAWLLEKHIYWTEQHLLLAWMLDNPRVRVLYGSAYHEAFNPDLLKSLMHGRCQAGGSSFWIEYRGGS